MRYTLTLVLVLLSTGLACAADWPIAFLQLKPAEMKPIRTQSVSEQNGPYVHHIGTDLVMLNTDGTFKTLVKGQDDAKGLLAVHDFCPTPDGKGIVYPHIRTFTDRHSTWADLFHLDLATGVTKQLTNARDEFSPPRGAAPWSKTPPKSDNDAGSNYAQKGIGTGTVWNVSPCCTPGWIVFCSNRDAVKDPASQYPAMQLYRMKYDGSCVERINHMSLGGVAHPTLQKSGRILFAVNESQSLNGQNDAWAIWSINPDGTDWKPEMTNHGFTDPMHFQTELTNGSLATSWYYDTRTTGGILVAPLWTPDPFNPGATQFGKPLATDNPLFKSGWHNFQQQRRFPWQRRGLFNLTYWTGNDDAEKHLTATGEKPGEVTEPMATPGNGLTLTWTGADGDAKRRLRIMFIKDGTKEISYKDLVPIVDKADHHCWYARYIGPFGPVYGMAADWTPPSPTGEKSETLPAGSPFGEIGSSGINFNEILGKNNVWIDPSTLTPLKVDDAEYIRILVFNPTTTWQVLYSNLWESNGIPNLNMDTGTEGFSSGISERTGFYSKLIPLKRYRKTDGTIHYGPNPPADAKPILRSDGKIDTSFRVQLLGDRAWTFQVLNAKKQNLAVARTWHQIRPGESRTNCQGCHAHWKPDPILFKDTFAASSEYKVERLAETKWVVFERDIKPISDKHGLNLTSRMWNDKTIPTMLYKSATSGLADNPALSDSEKELIYAWQDTGFMGAGKWGSHVGERLPGVEGTLIAESTQFGVWADVTNPTVAVRVYSDQLIVGSFDDQSGLNKSTLSIKATVPIAGKAAGDELVSLFTHNQAEHTWALKTAVPKEGRLLVSVRDNQHATKIHNLFQDNEAEAGNLTTREVSLSAEGTTPPPSSIEEELAKLQAQVTQLQADLAAAQAEIAALQARIQKAVDALQGK